MRPALLFAILTLLTCISGGHPSQAGPVTLIRAVPGSFDSPDPQRDRSAVGRAIRGDLYEGLVGLDPAGHCIPGAAGGWDVSADGKTYRFHLRPALSWATGDPLVAGDFVRGFLRLLDPALASPKAAALLSQVDITGAKDFHAGKRLDAATVGVTAPDDRTVVITLDRPSARLPEFLTFDFVIPVRRDATTPNFARLAGMASNGAYMLAADAGDSGVSLIKNPRYWRASAVKIDRIDYRLMGDAEMAVRLFQTGQVDIASGVPIDRLAGLMMTDADSLRADARPPSVGIGVVPAVTGDLLNRAGLTSQPTNYHLIGDRVFGWVDNPAGSHLSQYLFWSHCHCDLMHEHQGAPAL